MDAIGIRTTAIRDTGNNVKLINNSDLRNILNRSTANSKAVTSVSIAYEADLEKVEAEIAKFLPQIKAKYPNIFLEVPQYVGVDELADSGVILKFVATVTESNIFNGARLLNREIKIAFDKAGIEIPYNQIVLHNISINTFIFKAAEKICRFLNLFLFLFIKRRTYDIYFF